MSDVRVPGDTRRLRTPYATLAWGLVPPGGDRRAHARSMLRELLGPECVFYAVCPRCGGSHGPLRAQLPRGKAPLISVSYAEPLVVVGVAPAGATAFGIDVELDRADRRAAVAEATGSDEIRTWTRLEAAAKARHVGLRGDSSPPAASGDRNEWIAPSHAGHAALRGHDLRLTVHELGCDALLSVALTPRALEPSSTWAVSEVSEASEGAASLATADRAAPCSSNRQAG